MILVALPSAALANASSALELDDLVAGDWPRSASRSASAFAFCTSAMASASPCASRIFCSLTPSARRMADCFFRLGAQDGGLLFTLGHQDLAALFALGAQDGFAAFALRLHLLFHRVLDLARRQDVLELDPVDLDAPFVGRLIQDGGDLGVDDIAGGEGAGRAPSRR